jgi:hypothetical protein
MHGPRKNSAASATQSAGPFILFLDWGNSALGTIFQLHVFWYLSRL